MLSRILTGLSLSLVLLNCSAEVRDTGPADDCGDVSVDGECDGNIRRFCDLGRGGIVTVDCAASGGTCEFSADQGASCAGIASDCQSIGTAGVCGDMGEVVWCDGDSEADIKTQVCEDHEECQVDACAEGGAYCCPRTDLDECELIGEAGTCQDNQRRYCENGEVIVEDCESKGENCFLFPDGFSRCDPADISI